MNFTREPIIETIITPREGCKLVVRNSKSSSPEEYEVDAVEVVSFGHSFFFRSMERPKSFLVPVSDYEVVEHREARMPLKNVSAERSIKIGGGRDAPPRPSRAPVYEETPQDEELPVASDQPPSSDAPLPPREPRMDRKRDRRRRGRRGGRDRGPQQESDMRPPEGNLSAEGTELNEEVLPPLEEAKAPSFISKLFPPPPTLIKETLGRYKTAEQVEEEKKAFPVEPPLHDDDEV